MSALSPTRLDRILELARPHAHGVVVDVGCDHGKVAAALGAIASERRFHRLPPRRDLPRVVVDGLRAFREVQLAIITGMGPSTILKILDEAPRPQALVLHSPQHSHALRVGLRERGWRIEREALAPENGRYAEILSVIEGEESATGHELRFGPRLLEQGDPLLLPHARQLLSYWSRMAEELPSGIPRQTEAQGWTAWLSRLLESRESSSGEAGAPQSR